MTPNEKAIKEDINEKHLCYLKRNFQKNLIDIDFVKIEKFCSDEFSELQKICDDHNKDLDDLLQFFNTSNLLHHLQGFYNYCVMIHDPYQDVIIADTTTTIPEIKGHKYRIEQLRNSKIENDNINEKIAEGNLSQEWNEEEDIKIIKEKIKNQYELWINAYSINKAYEICQNDNSIIAYSHRQSGWSNPRFQLSQDLSLEISTNFGYGRSSYFYVMLIFKDIAIAPFSDWIYYQYAKSFEIIRYSQSYPLNNGYWIDAMEYSKEACNLSITDEEEFIKKHIIKECEQMVDGLEEILKLNKICFKIFGTNDEYELEFDEPHLLIQFRGEKISGALDFIEKIKEYNKVTSSHSVIDKIEKLNKIIQPQLMEEIEIISKKLLKLNDDLEELRPKYEKFIVEKYFYDKEEEKIRTELKNNGSLDVDNPYSDENKEKLRKVLNNKYPDYKAFESEWEHINKTHDDLTTQIIILNRNSINITSYIQRIKRYFQISHKN
jgi:hypothetical protein